MQVKFQKNVLLKNCTTYKIGGPAKYFFIAKTKEELISALQEAKKKKLAVLILGGGSNVLVSEKGYRGLAIKMQNAKIKIQNQNAKFKIVCTDAGTELTKLAYFTAEAGLSGLEWAAGIPGTVGGAIFGNAQAFGTKISDVVERIEVVNLKTLQSKIFTKKQCQFSLKNSIFKKNKNWVIVSAVLKLKKGEAREIKNKIKELLDYRKAHHPIDFSSAGSVFVNPEGKTVTPAGYLIEKCGLKGKRIGNAQISEKHANFIINLGGAKASDVLKLINLAKRQVKKIFGINLETEIQIVRCQ